MTSNKITISQEKAQELIFKGVCQESDFKGLKLIPQKITNTLKIKEWNWEITKPVEWTKPYNQIIIPKGWRKIKVWKLWRVLESEYMDEFLGDFKGKYNCFWCEQTNYNKKNNYASGLCLYRNLSLSSGYGGGLADSDGDGRVVFIRELKEKK